MAANRNFDPRALILSIGILSVLPILTPSPVTILSGGGGVLILAILLRVGLGRMLARTRKIIWFVVTIVLLQSITADGSVVFASGGFFFTAEGIFRGLELSACLVILLWGSTLLVWSTTPDNLVAAFEVWLHPFQRRIGALVMLVTVTMNLVPWLILRSRHLAFSFRARGVDIDSQFSKRVRFLFSASVPLFSSSSRAASQLAIAMESRGYHPGTERTSFVRLRFGTKDWILLAAAVTLASITISLQSW